MAQTTGNTKETKQTVKNTPNEEYKPSKLALGLGICMVAMSAGMTLYVKKSGSILNRIYDIQQNQIQRGAIKVGPITKKEWLDTKPKW